MVDIKGFKEWLEKQELAELSRRAYLNAVRSFMLHGFEEWTVQNGMRYRQMLVDEDMKPASINLMVSGLNRYAKWEGKLLFHNLYYLVCSECSKVTSEHFNQSFSFHF